MRTQAPSKRPAARSSLEIESCVIAPRTSALSVSKPADLRIEEGTIPGDALCVMPSNHTSASCVVKPSATPSVRKMRQNSATVSRSCENQFRLMLPRESRRWERWELPLPRKRRPRFQAGLRRSAPARRTQSLRAPRRRLAGLPARACGCDRGATIRWKPAPNASATP